MARAHFPRVIQQRVFTTEECKKIIDCQSTPVKSDGMGINYPIDIIDECSNNDWITNKVKDTLHKTNKRHYGFKDLKLFINDVSDGLNIKNFLKKNQNISQHKISN